MKLKPLRFVGHKIGPFDHIELNWKKDSHYTLIVAENGMGKTTLVTAIAACLSLGSGSLISMDPFRRFAHDLTSFAYLEIEVFNEIGRILYFPSLEEKIRARQNPEATIWKSIRISPNDVDSGDGDVVYSSSMAVIAKSWRTSRELQLLAAAYGISRNIQQAGIHGYRELKHDALMSILDPFLPIQSEEILQWVANQYINYALALAEQKTEEANAYLSTLQRLAHILSASLVYPLTFQVERNPFRLEVKQNGTTLSIDQLSDGTRSFLSWPLDYLIRASRVNWADPADSAVAPGLILVDEIDSHLHPEWQRRVMSVVSELLPETYIIATTHSPFVVGAADEAQVFQIYKDEQGQLKVKATFDEYYGQPADLVLQKAFVPSLYPPEMERKLERLSELAGKVAAGQASTVEKREHNALMVELAAVNPWLENLMALSQVQGQAA